MGRDALLHLDVIDAQGRRIATYSSPQYLIVPAPDWRARIADLTITPLPSLVGAYWVRRHHLNDTLDESGTEILPEWDRNEFHALSGLTIVLSIIACLWGRRSGLSTKRLALWVSLTVILGLAGFLAYRLSTHWPALVRCPRCAQKRPVTASTCPHCQAAWEPLPPSGAEIFDPA
jgi:hypothetical protein